MKKMLPLAILLVACVATPKMPEVYTSEGRICLKQCKEQYNGCIARCDALIDCENACKDILSDCYQLCVEEDKQ